MIAIQSSSRSTVQIDPMAALSQPNGASVTTSAGDVQSRILAAADALSLLFAVQCNQSNGQSIDAQDSTQDKAKQIQDCIKAAREAAERAREAAEDKGFWDDVCSVLEDIASVATVIAGAASVVATGGTSALAIIALAGALLSANADEIAEVTGAGGDFASALKYVGAAASIGSGVGVAAGLGSSLGTVSEGVARAAKTIQTVSMGVGAGATVGRGYASIRSGRAEGTRMDAEADGIAQRAQQRAAQREVGALVEGLKETNKSFRRAKESILDARQSQSDSQMAAINVGRFA